MGFNLLLDDSVYIEKNKQKIALIGVENWGDGFKKKGDIDKAIKKIKKDDFKVLMSHDPSHWEKIIVNHDNHFDLTLSGHTHGMQFGIEIPGFVKWSPVKYRYKYWAGVYSAKNQFINVNRGFGVLGYPGRVGIWPEISVIELKKKLDFKSNFFISSIKFKFKFMYFIINSQFTFICTVKTSKNKTILKICITNYIC